MLHVFYKNKIYKKRRCFNNQKERVKELTRKIKTFLGFASGKQSKNLFRKDKNVKHFEKRFGMK